MSTTPRQIPASGSSVSRRRGRGRFGSGVAGLIALVAVLALGPTGTSAAPAAVPADAVLYWSGVAATAITAGPGPIQVDPILNTFNPGPTPLRPPASSSVLGAMVHGAMYDAVAAIEGGLDPFATGVTAPPGASVNAAVAQAARDVLVARLSGVPAANVQTLFDNYMLTIPDGPEESGGRAVGVAAAAGMIAMRFGDGFDANPSYVPPPGVPSPGLFEPIGSRTVAPTTPVDLKLPAVRPFTYTSQSEYRPKGPLELTSKRYAKDLAELQAYGGDLVFGSLRTPLQTETVRFHTEQTFFQFNRTVRNLAAARTLDLREAARLLAYVNVATADTMIACWEAKYHYNFWRPTHAIMRADTDGNAETSPPPASGPAWFPLIVGNHPEYPSGHACFTGAVTESLHQYFGTKHVPLVISSTAAGAGAPRTYDTLDDLVEDVENARVWGGLHYRTTMTETAKHFPKIAREVGKHYFLEGAKRDKGKK